MMHREHHTLINGENFFDQPIKTNKVTYENIRKIGQGDDYTTGCLLGYPNFKDSYKDRLLKSGLALLKFVIKPLGMLGLTAAASATDPAINIKILESGATTLIISNDEMKDILKIVKSLEYSGVLLKGVSETIKNEVKERKGSFLSMLLGTLGASLLGNILASRSVIRAGEGAIRAGYESKMFLLPIH